MHLVKGLDCFPFWASSRFFLFLQDCPRMVSGSGKEEHQVGLELAQQRGLEIDRSDFGKAVCPKGYKIQSAESSCKFVLPAYMASQDVTCNVKGAFRQIIF